MKYTGRSSTLQRQMNQHQKQPNNNFSLSSSSSSQGKLFRGVWQRRRGRRRGRWVAEIRIPRSKKKVWLGTFDTAEEAAIAYDTAAYMLHGERAHLNFPDSKHQLKANSLKGTTAALLKSKLQANKKGSMESSSSQSPPSNEHSVQKYSNLMTNSNFGENSTRKERQFGLESNVGSDHEVIIESTKRHQDLVSDADAAAVELSRMSSLDMDMMIWDALQLPHS